VISGTAAMVAGLIPSVGFLEWIQLSNSHVTPEIMSPHSRGAEASEV
jgi:hypothetical protein